MRTLLFNAFDLEDCLRLSAIYRSGPMHRALVPISAESEQIPTYKCAGRSRGEICVGRISTRHGREVIAAHRHKATRCPRCRCRRASNKNGCTLLLSPATACMLAIPFPEPSCASRALRRSTHIDLAILHAVHSHPLSSAVTESASSIAVLPRAQGRCEYEAQRRMRSRERIAPRGDSLAAARRRSGINHCCGSCGRLPCEDGS